MSGLTDRDPSLSSPPSDYRYLGQETVVLCHSVRARDLLYRGSISPSRHAVLRFPHPQCQVRSVGRGQCEVHVHRPALPDLHQEHSSRHLLHHRQGGGNVESDHR